jgi:hypothetical protein
MKMRDVEVDMNEVGELVLSQEGVIGEDSVIITSPDQVPIVCEWMMRVIGARTEAREIQRLKD